MENHCIQPQEACPDLCIILNAFAVIEDPRRNQAKRHPLLGILVVETRQIMISHKIKEMNGEEEWRNLKAVIRLETKREKADGSYTQERRYFITSALASEEEYLKLIRNHWGIENGLHRTLDVHFKEDACQVREKNGAQNLSLLRKFAGSILHLLSPKRTLKSKMHLMMADPKFRLSFIQSNF